MEGSPSQTALSSACCPGPVNTCVKVSTTEGIPESHEQTAGADATIQRQLCFLMGLHSAYFLS